MPLSETSAGRKAPFRFRLIHVFYAMAVLGASLATCGVGGVVAAGAILGMWYAVFWGERPAPPPKDDAYPGRRSFTLAELVVVIIIIAVLIALLLPAVRSSREAARRSHCSNNLKQIALALHNYHDVYDSFPPAYFADANGKPMHSWRVLILPFLEQGPLFEKYRFDEPWDGPNNRALLNQIPEVYQCPAHGRRSGDTTSSYFAVVGPETIWPGAQSRTIQEVVSGTSNTMLVVEGPPHKIAWSEPRDLTMEEAIVLTGDPTTPGGAHVDERGFFYSTILGRNYAMADGSVRWLPPGSPRSIIESLIRIDRTVAPDEVDGIRGTHLRRIKWGNIMRLTILVCLAALPLPWAIARQRKSRS